MKRLVFGFIFALLFCLTAISLQSAEKIQEINKTFPFKNGGKLILKAGDGNIFITSGKTQEISLKITKRVHSASLKKAREMLNAITIDIRHQSDRVRIQENSPNENFSLFDIFSPDFWENRSSKIEVDYTLTVPPKTRLNIKTDDGNQTIQEIAGEIQARTDDGNIKIRNCSSETLSLFSDDGDMQINNIQTNQNSESRLFFETNDGRITIKQGKFDKISGKTDDGDLYLVNTFVHTLDISSNDGNVEAILSPLDAPVWRVQADAGDILLVAPATLSARLNILTDEGTISSDFRLPIKERENGAVCRSSLNGGNGTISLHTVEGDVQIEKK